MDGLQESLITLTYDLRAVHHSEYTWPSRHLAQGQGTAQLHQGQSGRVAPVTSSRLPDSAVVAYSPRRDSCSKLLGGEPLRRSLVRGAGLLRVLGVLLRILGSLVRFGVLVRGVAHRVILGPAPR